MDYISKKFKTGDILSALDLNNFDDGIIEAIELAEDAALKGAQADYNENDSTSASYIKNRPFYEGYAYEPITWNGVVGDRENVDVSAILPGAIIVKVTDTFLTYEELLNSVCVFNDGSQNIISADGMASKEEGDALGAYGLNSFVISCFDSEKVQAAMGIPLSVGTYFVSMPSQNLYVTSLSKGEIKKIDEKFIPGVYADGDIGIRFNGNIYSLHKILAAYFTDENLK